MGTGFGDRLARGSKSAAFPSMSSVPQQKWDDIFGARPLNISKSQEKRVKVQAGSKKNAANHKAAV